MRMSVREGVTDANKNVLIQLVDMRVLVLVAIHSIQIHSPVLASYHITYYLYSITDAYFFYHIPVESTNFIVMYLIKMKYYIEGSQSTFIN